MLNRKTFLKFAALLALLILTVGLTTGCATKKYVKQQIDPLTGKVVELEEITKKNTQDIRDVDARAQAGIQAANQKADAADSKAVTANQKAESAQSAVDQVARNVKGVESKLGNLDSYKLTDTTQVTFKTGQHDLNDEAKANLDAIATTVKDQKGFTIEIEGFTDSRGEEQLNLELSQKRAEAVKRYLAATHNIPLFRMSIIGVGEAMPVADNKKSEGRAKNRRVEVRLLRSALESGGK